MKPSTWHPGPASEKPSIKKPRVICTRPPASVWELGNGRQIAGTWPPQSEKASRYAPLGDWPEYQPREAA